MRLQKPGICYCVSPYEISTLVLPRGMDSPLFSSKICSVPMRLQKLPPKPGNIETETDQGNQTGINMAAVERKRTVMSPPVPAC